jgi:hypothetical protein
MGVEMPDVGQLLEGLGGLELPGSPSLDAGTDPDGPR